MGFGDDLMASGEARALAKRSGKKVYIGAENRFWKSEVFENNPILSFNYTDNHVNHFPGCRPYINYEASSKNKLEFIKYNPIPGNLVFTKKEILVSFEKVSHLLPFVFIEPNIKETVSADNKDWGEDRWLNLVKNLSNRGITVVQASHKFTSRVLEGVELIEVNSFRETCGLIFLSSLVITHEGGVHHASAALGVNSIVIFGGFISPEVTGYKQHKNLYISDKQSPCGMLTECDHCKKSMSKIKVEFLMDSIGIFFYLKYWFSSFFPKKIFLYLARLKNKKQWEHLQSLIHK